VSDFSDRYVSVTDLISLQIYDLSPVCLSSDTAQSQNLTVKLFKLRLDTFWKDQDV